MRFIDANVFLYVLTQSPKSTYEICKNILKRIEDGEKAATSIAVIQEVIDWLEYNNRRKEIATFMTAINSYLSLNKLSCTWGDLLIALDLMNEYKVDFVDALTLRIMKREGITEIYSNDTDFDKIEWVKRVFK